MAVLENLRTLIYPPRLQDHPAYKTAEAFKETIKPVEGANYDWVWDYAEEVYDRLSKVYKDLDDKANDIIKYLGGGAGLFTLGAIANVNKDNALLMLSALPALACALLSIFFAVLARKPNENRTPPSVFSAFRFAGHYLDDDGEDSKKAKAIFLGQWHLACEAMGLAVDLKSRRVAWATWTFLLSIALLLVPFIVAICAKLAGGDAPAIDVLGYAK